MAVAESVDVGCGIAGAVTFAGGDERRFGCEREEGEHFHVERWAGE